jgi:lipoprotein-releasing system permease protein
MAALARILAWRFLTYRRKDTNISFMLKVCFIGIFIGSFALMLTLIITNGFEKVIHEKMQGINAELVVYAIGNKIAYKPLRKHLLKECSDMIDGVSGSAVKQAIIDDELQTVLIMRGVDELHEHTVNVLNKKIVSPRLRNEALRPQIMEKLLTPGGIIIGHKLAKEKHYAVGDRITILLPEPRSKKSITLRKAEVTIAGIFNVGLEEYDNNLALCSLAQFHTWFNEEGVDQLSITLRHPENVGLSLTIREFGFLRGLKQYVQARFQALFGQSARERRLREVLHAVSPDFIVRTWQDLYPALVASLKLEKYVMFIVIALITLVASMNMVSLLFMQIQQKRRDIAIFQAMGMPHTMISEVFLYIGLFITIIASTLGLLMAGIVGYVLERYPCIELPDVYYISYLPARLDAEIFIIVFIVTLLIGFVATWLPASRTRSIKIAQVLREE